MKCSQFAFVCTSVCMYVYVCIYVCMYVHVCMYMCQSRVEIKGYSIAYFDRIATFEASYC